MEKRYGVITTTCSTREEAEAIAAALLEKRLAACVQLDDISSRYIWADEICKADEVRLTIKCRRDRYNAIRAEILSMHSNQVPEIILLPVETGHGPYLDWIEKTSE